MRRAASGSPSEPSGASEVEAGSPVAMARPKTVSGSTGTSMGASEPAMPRHSQPRRRDPVTSSSAARPISLLGLVREDTEHLGERARVVQPSEGAERAVAAGQLLLTVGGVRELEVGFDGQPAFLGELPGVRLVAVRLLRQCGSYDVLIKRGYQIDFMTATGRKPPALPPSMEPGFLDPPLHKKVVTDEHYARRTHEIHESSLLVDPIDLSAWFLQMPYFNGPNFGQALEEYYTQRDACWKDLEKYDALLLPGGSGPMVDMVNNERLHDVILGFLAQDKLIAAECYCVTALAFAGDGPSARALSGASTSPAMPGEYDWKDGTGFAQMYGYDGEPMNTSANFRTPFYPLE